MNSPFPKSSSAAGEGKIIARLQPDGVSGLETITYQYPLKLISPSKPAEDKSVLVFLLSYGGGLVGGDQGHTKVFTSTKPDIVTRQTLRAEVAAGGALCLLPDPVQPFAGSVYEQTQIFKLAKDASLCLLDWVTQGRSARGEDWSFVRWLGRNEVWTRPGDGDNGGRLLVQDSLILDSAQAHPQMKTLRESMHAIGIMGTLILRGPLMKSLGEFFLDEFAALPRIGARDWRSEDAKKAEVNEGLSAAETWRRDRLKMEKESGLLWSAALVRGCVVVKFGAPEVEAGRAWIGSMLVQEGSIDEIFGNHALLCVK